MSAPPLARLRKLIAEGMSYSQLARATGLTGGQVAGLIRRRLAAEWAARPNPRSFRQQQGQRPVNEPPPVVALGDLALLPPEPAPPFRGCQWVEGDGRPVRFCGAPVVRPGCAWCREHHAIAYHRRAA